jgi:D-3-phosphoglycerate dehydrogenase
MKRYSIIRTHLSPYQLSGFKDLEKSRLESLGVSYLDSDSQITDESELIVITNTHTKFESLSEKIKNKAKLVIHPNSGYENFESSPELQKIPVIVGNEVRAQAVAEYALSCFVDFWTKRPLHSEWDKERAYPRKLMNQTTALIIGQGQIGKLLLTMLTALGVKVTTVDPRTKADYKNIQDLTGTFDSVILAASLNSKSFHIVNQNFLKKFNPKVLINPSRGGFINEADLIAHLNNSQMSAYLDVFEKEPLPVGQLSHPRLYKTSHIAGVHDDLDQGIIEFEYKVLKDYLNLSEKDFMLKYQEALLANKWFQGELW